MEDGGKASVRPRRWCGGAEIPSLDADRSTILAIDAQGSELHVLAGASNLFDQGRIDAVQLEFAPQLLMSNGVDPTDVLEFLHRRGFACFDCAQEYGRRVRSKPPNARAQVVSHEPNLRDTGSLSRDLFLFDTTFASFELHYNHSTTEHGEWVDMLCV
mmetsp:Transcript_27805/g.60291  ORF Transcript_27805/g.60291 Transcript_27805/m.60291 type:complete len:158 (+) Transcript_27805:3-476(+)